VARIIRHNPSRTLAEFRLLPGLTTIASSIGAVDLSTRLAWFPEGERELRLSIPVAGAAMQSVSGAALAVEMARLGGTAFIFCSQPAESQAEITKTVKTFRPADEISAAGLPGATDAHGRALCVAAVNTHDFERRVPCLVDAGADALAIDASDGYSVYQERTIAWILERFPHVPVVGGNIVTAEGFRFLAEAGARAVKVGMGSGSICITQEQKGTGRGLATAIIEVAQERDEYCTRTGKYLPLIADGGLGDARDVVTALALGADYVMMGRFLARTEESPNAKVQVGNRVMKPYWGEGSARAREWHSARYHQAAFPEGVEGFVEYAGPLKDNLDTLLAKVRAAMSSCGCANIIELHEKAEVELVSALSIREGQVHDVFTVGGEHDNSMKWNG